MKNSEEIFLKPEEDGEKASFLGSPASFSEQILFWYDQNARQLPWREKEPNPYKVWLSEVMLQQTTVGTATPYFLKFITKFPTVACLAKAQESEVLRMWEGLGYYSRARNLLKCALILVEKGFPKRPSDWISLPGIGPYTAAAVSAIAFEYPVLALDGNIKRVMSRVHAKNHVNFSDPEHSMLPENRFGDYNQALMDLGALICKPKNPQCFICPVQRRCLSFALGKTSFFPEKKQAVEKRKQKIHVLIIKKGEFVFIQNQEKDLLLKGLYIFPVFSFEKDSHLFLDDLDEASLRLLGKIKHIFTHIEMTVDVYFFDSTASFLQQKKDFFQQGKWVLWRSLSDYPFSKLMRKVQSLVSDSLFHENSV
jgi:A/G-specific adenine glycosylase